MWERKSVRGWEGSPIEFWRIEIQRKGEFGVVRKAWKVKRGSSLRELQTRWRRKNEKLKNAFAWRFVASTSKLYHYTFTSKLYHYTFTDSIHVSSIIFTDCTILNCSSSSYNIAHSSVHLLHLISQFTFLLLFHNVKRECWIFNCELMMC